MFTERSQEKELLDLGPQYYSHDEYKQCLQKLFLVSKFLGFFRSTVKILNKFPKTSTVLDVGCGGGLFILHLSKVFPSMKMLGTDISAAAIQEAQKSLQFWKAKHPETNVSFYLQEHFNLADVILLTLVCHHLTDEELVIFLRQAHSAASHAVIINDLHRHRLAHWLYSLVSPVFFNNRLITHDGLISIRRGFTRAEWKRLLQLADIQHYQLRWCFPFRWKLILWKV